MFYEKLSSVQKKLKSNPKYFVFILVGIFIIYAFFSFDYSPVKNTKAGAIGDFFNSLKNGFQDDESLIKIPGDIFNQDKKDDKNQTFSDSHEQAVVSSVEKASPSVVSIIISKDLPVIEQCPYNPFSNIPEEFQQFFNFGNGGSQFYQPCQKGTKKQEIGGGSGFIVSKDGLILTNKHVVSEKNAEYAVFTNDGKKYTAKVLATHPTLDIALIKINATDLSVAILGNSDNLKLGQTAIAIGNALGEFRNTVSVGVISGLSRNITASSGGTSEVLQNVIQTDAAINPGNSGGPLINSRGEVIGINVAMVSGAQNIGFAVPINAAKKSIESVSLSGKIKVAFLGVRYVMLNDELSKKYKVEKDYGALIKGDGENFAVEIDSPAERAGLKEGDIILEIDGQKLGDDKSLAYVISQKNSQDKVNLKILRKGEEINIEVILGERK